MHAESNKLLNQAESRMYHALWPISATVLHWTSILSKTFTSVTQISRIPTHPETIWFLSHKLYDAKQCELYAQIFPGILYPARLLTRHIISHHERARHRHDALIPLSETFGSQPFNSRVLSQSEHYARAPRDIQYQRVKIYIFILSHLGGFNKRV